MSIAGIEKFRNPYPLSPKPVEAAKAADAKEAPVPRTDTVTISKTGTAAYYDGLQQKFECVKNGSVSIAGAYLDRCAKDPKQAKRLEEGLAAYQKCVAQGYENAVKSVQAAGGRLLSYRETWSIDGSGSLTITSSGTVEDEAGTKDWEEVRKGTLEHMAGKAMEEEKEAQAASQGEGNESEKAAGKVAVNQGKRARQIAAAKCKSQVQQVIALLRKDMADCKAGLEKGWCDESEIAKVQALLNSAQARLNQVSQEAKEEPSLSEFDIAGLM